MKNEFYDALFEFPTVAAIKDVDGLDFALKSDVKVVFVLFGDICNIESIVKQIKESDKIAIVHIDLIDGLANRDVAVNFLKVNTLADGVISTKANIIKKAKEVGFITVQRCFILDSLSLEASKRYMNSGYADAIEILPGVMPKIIKKIVDEATLPIIAGGLIEDKEDIILALQAGATAVSSTKKEIWLE
ncbi:glycerol-3-phosphate responsive antiterminator [Clostridium ihumii]|uniref:glycerol-3-phosphate responsive antiterminator n=1 Tax=Clostridium ihumii TaxID=1470356 RepID=UPI003D3553A1